MDMSRNAKRDYSTEAAASEELKAYEARWAATAQDESTNIRGRYPTYFSSSAFSPKIAINGLTSTPAPR
jgi:hypothetical protein